MSFVNFPSQLVPMLQTGFLARFMEEGLDSNMAYRRESLLEQIPGRIGQSITLTRVGRKAPVPIALNASSLTSNFDNGLTPSLPSVEQYSYNLAEYGDAEDIDIMGELAGIANQLKAFARTSGVQAAQTLERIAKSKLFAAYNTGNTFVRTDLGSSTTTTCYVDDIRGFQNVYVNGVPVPVSNTYPLLVNEIASSSGGVTQVLTVTAATPQGTNHSVYPSDNGSTSAGISGTLTFSSATAPVNGDALIAENAATVLRPSGKTATCQLNTGDLLTLSLMLDAKATLSLNATPVFPDGTYHAIMDDLSMRQLFADQNFAILYAGQYGSPEFKSGQVFVLLGITFITTTEAYVQPASSVAGVNVTVRRPIVLGAEVLLQGNFEGLELWLDRQGFEAIGNVALVDGIAQILRPPLDRLQRMVSLSWTWIGDFAVPTDVTCTQAIVPTCNNATFKRAVVIEHAG